MLSKLAPEAQHSIPLTQQITTGSWDASSVSGQESSKLPAVLDGTYFERWLSVLIAVPAAHGQMLELG